MSHLDGAALRMIHFRWLLLAIFPVGYFATQALLVHHRAEYFELSIASAVVCAVLLVRLRSIAISTWPIWIIFGAFLVAYYVKFYLLILAAAAPTSSAFLIISAKRLALISQPDIAIAVFRYMTIGFAVFCIVGALLIRPKGPLRRPSLVEPTSHAAPVIRRLFLVGVGLLVVTTAVALALNILAAGIAEQRRSFQIVGWIFYARSVLVVVLFMVALQYGIENRFKHWIKVGIGFLLIYALSEILVTSTRASFLVVALSIAFLYGTLQGRLDKKVWRGVVALAVIGVVMFPAVTYYRQLRIMGGEGGASLALNAFRFIGTQGSLADVGLTGAVAVIMRFIGADSLFFLTDPQSWLGLSGVLDYPGTISRYFTRVVVGVPQSVAHAEAPSLLGWFLITGGVWNLLLGFAVYLTLGWVIWSGLSRAELILRPVAQVHFLLLWLSLSSEGTLDQRTIHVVAVVTSIGACEFLLRRQRRRAGRARISRPVRALHTPGEPA